MVGRCSEVLERVAVEPKMIRTPDLKIRSLGHASGSGQTRRFRDVGCESALAGHVRKVPQPDIGRSHSITLSPHVGQAQVTDVTT
jgi:hypothetical protein